MIRQCTLPKRAVGQRLGSGFSLVEAMIATFLVGLGVASVMVATKSATEVNAAGRQITQSTYLAQEIRELDEQYTSACKNNDLDMVEWAEGQFFAFRRAYGDLYGEAREEIADEDRKAQSY